MRNVWMVSLLVSAGCESQICAFIGEFTGAYEGAASGEMQADVTESDESDVVNVNFLLKNDPDDFSGSAKVSCTDGELVMDLTDVNGLTIGNVTGTIAEGFGSGGYTLDAGGEGTWEYSN